MIVVTDETRSPHASAQAERFRPRIKAGEPPSAALLGDGGERGLARRILAPRCAASA
jgi:hypothetical protein